MRSGPVKPQSQATSKYLASETFEQVKELPTKGWESPAVTLFITPVQSSRKLGYSVIVFIFLVLELSCLEKKAEKGGMGLGQSGIHLGIGHGILIKFKNIAGAQSPQLDCEIYIRITRRVTQNWAPVFVYKVFLRPEWDRSLMVSQKNVLSCGKRKQTEATLNSYFHLQNVSHQIENI